MLGLHFIIWMIVAAVLDVHPDMADHWVWSRYLQWGYYEHPPFVAVTMRIWTMIAGSSVLSLKIGSVLFSTVIMWACYQVGSLFFDRRAALISIVILELTPYFSMGSVFWHIDQPYMLCWLGCMYTVGRYIKSGNINWFFPFALIAGIGALSKYNMILLPVSLVVWCAVNRDARRLVGDPRLYLAALIAIAIVAPNLYWNAQNDWRTFTFVFEKGLTGSNFGENFIQFFPSQLLLFSAVYSIYFWSMVIRRRIGPESLEMISSEQRSGHAFLLITGTLPVGVFTITSFMGSLTDPHWVNVAYFSAFLLMGRMIDKNIREGAVRKQLGIFSGAALLNTALVIFTLAHVLFRVAPISEPNVISLKKMVGWSQTARQIEQLVKDRVGEMPPFVISREYQTASALSLYLKDQPMPHAIEKQVRNVWSPESELDAKGAVMVCPPRECTKTMLKAKGRFRSSFKLLGTTEVVRHGVVFRRLDVYILPAME